MYNGECGFFESIVQTDPCPSNSMEEAMKPRERVLAALNHREPDRIPIDFGGHRSSGIHASAYAKLRDFLGLEEKPIRVYDVIQQLAIVDRDVLDRFEADTVELGRAFALDDESWADWTLPDGTPCQVPVWIRPERQGTRWVIRSKTGRVIAQMPDGALYFEQTYFPFAEKDDPENIPDWMGESMWTAIACPPGPLAEGPDGINVLSEGARTLRDEADRAIIGLFGGNLLEIGQFLYRNDNFFMLLASDPKRAHSFLDKLVEMHLANLETFLGAVGDYIDVILFGDDLGMQTGPQVSPAMYREFLKPRHKLMWQRAKQLADIKVMLHCCGGIRELLPDLIEAGLDTTNPVQTNCTGMDAAELKKEFGKDIAFWGGGCDNRDVLPNRTPDEIKRHVKEQIGILSPGGGFVFQQIHNIMADVPPENIVAMFDAALGRA
jgi:uroporphyrinogen decarboxylase